MTPHPVLTPEGLDQAIEALLLGSPISRGRRLLGIEFERILLDREDRTHAPLAFCREFLADLAEDLHATPVYEGEALSKALGGDFALSMEPGGQLEVATAPRPVLSDLDGILAKVDQVVAERLAATPYELVAIGHTPVTPVEEIGLLPKPRYRIMDATMPSRGPLTRNMMRATAGFQCAFDITGRDDAARKLALLFRLTPALLATSANSRMIAGKDSGFASFRHKVWFETDRDRVGIPEGCLHAETALEAYIRYAREATALFIHRDGEVVAAPEDPFEILVARGEVTLADLDLHLSSLFPMIRIRNYLEVRCFDAVPWPLARSLVALLSGLLYCPAATTVAEEVAAILAPNGEAAIVELNLVAARDGLDGVVPGHDTTFRELMRALVDPAAGRLGQVDCTWARPIDLQPLRDHLGS